MTQHDKANDTTPGNGEETRPEDVTREQNGQFSTESESVGAPLDEAFESGETMSFSEAGLGTVNAMQVSMDRSGAEYVHAQKAFLTNAGAKTIEGESSKLSQSGVLLLKTQKAELHQSSAVAVLADAVQVESGSIALGMIDEAHLGERANVGVLVAGDLDAAGDVRSFMMVAGDVKAGGSVQTTVDAQSAAIFGAVFGAVFALVWRMIRRG